MEFAAKLDFCFDVGIIVAEGHLRQLHAESELAALVDLVLILHVRMHIAEEKLLIVLIAQTNPHTLIRSLALVAECIVGLHYVFEDWLVKNLNFHLKSLSTQVLRSGRGAFLAPCLRSC